MELDTVALDRTLAGATAQLLGRYSDLGYWEGKLSSSALATAASVFALAQIDPAAHASLIRRGLKWLKSNVNTDGGWGDTTDSESNLSTTLLVWSGLSLVEDETEFAETIRRTRDWLHRRIADPTPASLAKAVLDRYGEDRTFSVPILTMCALSGRLGDQREAWGWVRQLPFELAALPRALWRWAPLSVVSYALPALIAIGLVRHRHRPSLNPVGRLVRDLSAQRALRLLDRIQPSSGGFLEAPPLTGFVAMGLVGSGLTDHPVVGRAANFLLAGAKPDGSWAIDTNLRTWVTTLSVNAVSEGGTRCDLTASRGEAIGRWLLEAQMKRTHPYTNSPPGGWAWTDLPGGVPDADDTAGALLALHNLGVRDGETIEAVMAGTEWLMGLQNRDGGVPTFSRGWGALPFDRSAPDLTGHAIRAVNCWKDRMPGPTRLRAAKMIDRAVGYLDRSQRHDGAWIPLWFGNQSAPDQQNPAYGTARVVSALVHLRPICARIGRMLGGGVNWLLKAQNQDAGWGGAPGVDASIEETALATAALAEFARAFPSSIDNIDIDTVRNAAADGANWLIEHTERGRSLPPKPIGLYFAKLWYSERLYPAIFTVAALRRLRDLYL